MDIFEHIDAYFVGRLFSDIDQASIVCMDGNVGIEALRATGRRAREAGVRGGLVREEIRERGKKRERERERRREKESKERCKWRAQNEEDSFSRLSSNPLRFLLSHSLSSPPLFSLV